MIKKTLRKKNSGMKMRDINNANIQIPVRNFLIINFGIQIKGHA